jgi:hypothetical protein
MAVDVGVQPGRICPRCEREESVPLIWGLPSPELMSEEERGLVALGGCMRPGEDFTLHCRACGLEWGRRGGPTANEQELADLLGVRYVDVVRALGTGWRRGFEDRHRVRWFVSGEPAQVALGVHGPTFVLARPLTRWGEGGLDLQPADRHEFGRDDLLHLPELVAEEADAIASRRRRSFRWCRMCRRVHPPEWFVSVERVCQECESAAAALDADL